jgi:hypothetical protein
MFTLSPTGRIFMKFDILVVFQNLSKKFRFIKIRLYAKTNIQFWPYLAQFLQWERFRINVTQKMRTHTLSSIYFFFFENRSVNEKMLKNTVQPHRMHICY